MNPTRTRALAARYSHRQTVGGPRLLSSRLAACVLAICFATAAAGEVRQVAIGSTPGLDSTYSAGDRISVTVQFDDVVEVTGAPVLEIDIGGTTRRAPMWMHGGSRLHFGYTVRAADNDPDGISIEAGAIKLAGGRIDGRDGDAAAISLRGHTIANAPEHRVDGTGAWAPSIVSVSVTSNPGVDGIYSGGDVIEITAEFDEQVFVEGLPTLRVDVGSDSREAPYRGGSGSHRLTFTSRVWDGNLAAGGIVLPESGLAGGAGITDADGNIAQTDYEAPGRQPRHRVDGVGPQVVDLRLVSTPPSGGVYGEGDMVEVEVTFNEEVYLTGPGATMPIGGLPQVDDGQMGGGGRAARAVASDERSILFRFPVLAQDASEGVYFGRGPLARPAALSEQWQFIQDRAGNPASPLYSNANRWHGASIDGSRSDTTPPAVRSVAVASMPRTGSTYRRHELLAVRVLFTEGLRMAGAPGIWATLELSLGADVKPVGTWIGNGADSALFTHPVAEADVDSDGVSLSGELHVGPVEDAAGNAIDGESLSFTPFTATEHKVNGRRLDSARPKLVDSGPTRGGGSRLTFDAMVVAQGNPEFLVGGTLRASRFRPPLYSFVDKDVSRWHIDYGFPSIAEDDFDHDGIEVPTDGWAKVSFHDARGRPVIVGPQDIALIGRGFPVVGPAYHGVSLRPPPHGGTTFGEGNTLAFDVVFAQAVNIGGAARLKVGVRELPCTPRNGRHRHFVCSRTIATGENVRGLELARGAFRLIAISIKDDEGNNVNGDLSAYADTIEPFSVDTRPPRLEGVSIASTPAANGTYGAGAVVSAVARFSEPVLATGSEQLALVIGDQTRLASLDGTSGADGLRFTYVVSRADTDSNGVAIPANALRLEGGAITDVAGNPAGLSHGAVGEASTHRVNGGVADISTTRVRVQVRTPPEPGFGSPTQAATSSLTWEPTSTWSRQPQMEYAVTANHPDVLVGRASGRVGLGQRVTNNLRMPCGTAGTANVRLTISVKGAATPVPWDVLCRDGVIRVAEVELFQGPLAGRFGPAATAGRVDAIEGRSGVARVSVEHESAATPELAVGLNAPGGTESLAVDYLSSERRAGGNVSRYVVPLAPTQIGQGRALEVVADPNIHLDADVGTVPQLSIGALAPKTLPVFKPVFVPIQILGEAPDLKANALLEVARSLLPIGRVKARVREPFVYEPSDAEATERRVQASRLHNSIVQLANEEAAADEFYIGIGPEPAGWVASASMFGTVSILQGDSVTSPQVAHALGWALGLEEVACQTLGDPAFPHEGIGAEGSWSAHEQRFITARDDYYDLMSGCSPAHVSIHSYLKAMAWGDRVDEAVRRNRRQEPASLVDGSAVGAKQGNGPSDGGLNDGRRLDIPTAARSLALSGSVDEHGFWSLFASATSPMPPRADAPGNFVLTLHDDSGIETYRQRLATAGVGGAPALGGGTWAVRVPMQARDVSAVRIRNASGGLVLDADVQVPAQPMEQAR